MPNIYINKAQLAIIQEGLDDGDTIKVAEMIDCILDHKHLLKEDSQCEKNTDD